MKQMKQVLIVLVVSLFCIEMQAQRLLSKEGKVRFFSSAPLEDIEATNDAVAAIIDLSSGKVQVSMFIKNFEFKKALMQEHFNENYMESEKFPKSTFTGTIDNFSSYDFTKEGTYEVTITGKLTIHGVETENTLPVSIQVNKKVLTAKSVFIVKTADYKIEIPALVRDNIAKEVEVTVEVPFTMK